MLIILILGLLLLAGSYAQYRQESQRKKQKKSVEDDEKFNRWSMDATRWNQLLFLLGLLFTVMGFFGVIRSL